MNRYGSQIYKKIDQFRPSRRTRSAKPVEIKGLNYKFRVINHKYEDRFKYGVFNWPVKFATVGKKVKKNANQEDVLMKEIHFDTLLRVLKETDWSKTPLYEMFQ